MKFTYYCIAMVLTTHTMKERCTRQAPARNSNTVTACLMTMVILIIFAPCGTVRSQSATTYPVDAEMRFVAPPDIAVGGVLGEALSASRKGRLAKLPAWNDGALIKMFGASVKNNHHKTDWYGEHAGKWLYATARAATHDAELKKLLLETADYLVDQQEADGYLGTYSPKVRLTNAAARHNRSWDAWSLSYMTLGLLEVNRYFPQPRYLTAATKIGALFLETFGPGKKDITEYGTRHGISATIVLDPVVELYKITNDRRYLTLAETIIDRMEQRSDAHLISVPLNGGDMEAVGDGKAYQLLWNLTAIAKLYEVTGKHEYFEAVSKAWDNIVTHHLTIAGGPWGGVGKHLECFNKRYFWSPYGFIETCSTMSWIQLNKVLLRLTGDAKYAEEIERAAYNALLGAQYPNGVDWAYHSFSNGRRHIAHFDDCCPSSGALALEELPTVTYAFRNNGIACNLFTPNEATLALPHSNKVRLVQETDYPFNGHIRLTVSASKAERFPLFIRIPAWTEGARITVNGVAVAVEEEGGYVALDRVWRRKDVVDIDFPMTLAIHHRTEKADSPQGGPDLFRVRWFALTRGPLVFAANGLIDGNREQIVALPAQHPETHFTTVEVPEGFQGPAWQLERTGDKPILFLPYYQAGGRSAGTWRLTWLPNAIN